MALPIPSLKVMVVGHVVLNYNYGWYFGTVVRHVHIMLKKFGIIVGKA